MAKQIDTQNVSIHKDASAAALAQILAAEPPWLNVDTIRRQQGRAIARAYTSGWQPRDFVEAYVKARAGACTAEERANAEAVYTKLKADFEAGTLKPSRPRRKASDGVPEEEDDQDTGVDADEANDADQALGDDAAGAGAVPVGGSEQQGRRTSAGPIPAGMDVVPMDVSLDEFATALADHADRANSKLAEAEQ